ncbi:MAG: Uridine kinase, partial [uncultured Solirubrobacteraceae bacterium]
GPTDHARNRGGLGVRQDDAEQGTRAAARRGHRHRDLHRRLPQVRPPPARRARHHAAEPGVQLHRHHGPAPAVPAPRRGDPQAGLPAHERHVRPARVPRPQQLHGHRGTARLPQRGDALGLRRARLPRPARVAAAPVEGRPRLLQARLHDRRGARRPRPPRAGFRGVHPPPAPPRRHRRLPHGERGRPVHPRRAADAARRPGAPRPDPVRRRERRSDHARRARRRERAVHPGRTAARVRRGDRGDRLGPHALRAPPALREARRVHRRQPRAPLGVACARAAADRLPPDDGTGAGRARRRSGRAGRRTGGL